MIELSESGKHRLVRLIAGKDLEGKLDTFFKDVDCKEQGRSETNLLNEGQLLSRVINMVPGVIYLRDVEGRFLMANLAAADLFDCAVEELLSLSGEESSRLLNDGHKHLREDIEVIVSNKPCIIADELLFCAKGKEHYFRTDKIPFCFENQLVPEAVLSVGIDITETKTAERQVKSQANFDPLTGLGNRNQLRLRLKQALLRSNRTGTPGALMFLDLDNFREINEVLGHATGDELLKQVAKVIRAMMTPSCLLVRLSGDEFAILLPEISSENQATQLADDIIHEIEMPFIIGDNRIDLRVSIGSVFFPKDAEDYEELFKRVDLALASAKRQGGGCHIQFKSEMHVAIQRRRAIATQLLFAIEKDQFHLHYQPLISARTGELVGMEALMRWEKEEGPVSPVEFIPVAEQTGLIVPMGEWVINRACEQMGRWVSEFKSVRIAINLSTVQFRQKNLLEIVRRILRENKVAPENIEFEITESTLMNDLDEAVHTMQCLHDLGIHLAIDDFGTGYSSLNYLKRFPINKVKIDRSFVKDIETDADSAAITRAIINLGHSLGVAVVAEGVESAGQLEFLRKAECDVIQGYYYARPLSGDKFIEWVGRQKVTHNATQIKI